MKFKILTVFAMGFLCLGTQASKAEEPNLFLTLSYPISPVVSGKSWRELFRDCLNQDDCSAAVDAAAGYFGVPPGTIQETVNTVDAMELGPDIDEQGDEFRMTIPAPDRYFLCQAHLKIISTVPLDGSKKPNFDMTAQYPGACWYAFLPKRSDGGRTWVDAVYTAKYMLYSQRHRPENASCFYETDKVRESCWGGGCQTNGPLDGTTYGAISPFNCPAFSQ